MTTSKTSPTAGETKAEAEGNVPSGTVDPVIAVNDAETAQDDTPNMAELDGIRYVGMADSKTISQADLVSLGVEDPKGDLVWDASNGKVVPTKEFNAATRDALLALPDFVVA